MKNRIHNQIHIEKQEAFFKDLVIEAFANLYDSRLNTLEITQVKCSRGMYHAKIYIESSDLNENEQKEILKLFKKARYILQNYIFKMSGKYSVPKLEIVFDNTLIVQNQLDNLFSRVK